MILSHGFLNDSASENEMNSSRSHGVDTISAVHEKDVYFLPLVARRRVLAPTSERSTVLGFALRGIKHTSFPVGAEQSINEHLIILVKITVPFGDNNCYNVKRALIIA